MAREPSWDTPDRNFKFSQSNTKVDGQKIFWDANIKAQVKFCSICKCHRELSYFYKTVKAKTGYKSICKACDAELTRLSDPKGVKRRAYGRRYARENRERTRARYARYESRHREARRAQEIVNRGLRQARNGVSDFVRRYRKPGGKATTMFRLARREWGFSMADRPAAVKWILAQVAFRELYSIWVESGYKRNMGPQLHSTNDNPQSIKDFIIISYVEKIRRIRVVQFEKRKLKLLRRGDRHSDVEVCPRT